MNHSDRKNNNQSHGHKATSRLQVGECLGSTRTGSGSEGEADRHQMARRVCVSEVPRGGGLGQIQIWMSTRLSSVRRDV